jgi:peptidoglycan hydrolase-like protein with peptidoglycan-binding domain
MPLRTAIPVTLALLVAAGFGLCGTAAARGTTSKSSESSTSSKSHASSKKTRARRGRKEKGQTAPTPERVSEIQQALGKDGSFAGTPNGKWDESTVEAMRKFQGTHGLNPSGKLDARTLQKLGLGSQTAGVAPPMPPVNSSSRTTPLSQSARRQ